MLKIYFACFTAFLNSAINGYDLSLLNGLLALKSFQNSFNSGLPFDATSPALLSLLMSALSLGTLVGCAFAGALSDSLGRVRAMMVGSCIIIVGTLVEIATDVLWVYMTGRFLIGK
jgi:MFS family permease